MGHKGDGFRQWLFAERRPYMVEQLTQIRARGGPKALGSLLLHHGPFQASESHSEPRDVIEIGCSASRANLLRKFLEVRRECFRVAPQNIEPADGPNWMLIREIVSP